MRHQWDGTAFLALPRNRLRVTRLGTLDADVLVLAVLHGGATRQEPGALAIARDTYARRR